MRKIIYIKIFFILSLIFPNVIFADEYDDNNYRPENSSINIEQSNLPIVFIDTRHGSDYPSIIHKDYDIVARMKIIMNKDGINFGDTIIYPNQTVNYEGWISIQYRGNTSFSASEKKPFNIKTLVTDNVNAKKQKVEIMGMPKDNKWTLLAPYNDRSLIRDVLMFQLARPYFDYVPRVRHCELILDGYYYGIYVMAEKPSKGKYRLNLDDPGDNGDELTGGYQLEVDRDDEQYYYRSKHIMKDKNGKPYIYNNSTVFQYKHPDYEEMTTEQVNYIQNQIDLMEQTLDSDDFTDSEKGYRKYLDHISFIDQQLSQEVSGNIDGYRLSTNIYKKRDSQDPRFKTTLWDFNLAFGNAMQMGGTKTDYWVYQNTYVSDYDYKVPFWWSRMMEDPAYVNDLKARWKQYREGSYSDKAIEHTIDSLVNHLKINGALERNNKVYNMFGDKWVWPVPNFETNNTYEKEINYLKTWLKERINWLDEQLEFQPEYTGIKTEIEKDDKQVIGYYNLQGKLLTKPQKGITIIRYKNRISSKIITK